MQSARKRLIIPFLAPALILYLIFYLGPAIASVWISLHVWSGFGEPMRFIGIRNYLALLEDPLYQRSFLNTFGILVLVGVSVFVLGFLFTIILRELKSRRILRAMLFFPNIVAPVVLAIVWGFMLNPNFGLVNSVFRAIGMDSMAKTWMGGDLIYRTLLVALTWLYTGFYTTIILAGVDKVPPYYYEAAEIEGANWFQKFRWVTLPLTWDVVAVAAVLWSIQAIKLFEFIYAMTGLGSSTPIAVWTTGIHMFLISFGNREPIYKLGYGSAIAVTMVILVAICVLLLRRVLRRERIEF